MKNIIKQTAKQYGVTVKEVRRDIAEMIKVGMSSTDPEAVLFWSQFGGKAPTPEKFLAVMASSVNTRL
ncbi:sporulation initiation factor Spo0A C-terminal domain-containing protein [Ruminococcus sp.]|uniref:sporulation initiation factor Spo0A C-terminal domain-containing protein n=1 Tax=Ruminococcus sp. TaxID=41978 RepID=UPI0025CCED71|nr:sporulation initiation factor Spo0A C-terminal domain-containing protein [Ruminococcus sp.]MBR1433271.1 hypothetical protein [Ruminococcus sp.]